MGQAAVDLPDPLNPPPAEPAANTDDLLAQMAGEEIDRLLAEQEVERQAKPSPGPRGAAAPPVPSKSKPAASGTVAQAATDGATLNGLLGEIAPASAAEADPVANLAAAQAPSEGKSSAELLDEELAADEARAAMNSSKFHAGTDSAVADTPSQVPLLLRVLAWISTPLDACPDHVREAIGKIAIVTTVNAIAVLVYVLFFRPHHG